MKGSFDKEQIIVPGKMLPGITPCGRTGYNFHPGQHILNIELPIASKYAELPVQFYPGNQQ